MNYKGRWSSLLKIHGRDSWSESVRGWTVEKFGEPLMRLVVKLIDCVN